MTVIRWDPLSEVTTLREKLDRIMEETFPWREKEKSLIAPEWPSSEEIPAPELAASDADRAERSAEPSGVPALLSQSKI
jgi:hypothetical protein